MCLCVQVSKGARILSLDICHDYRFLVKVSVLHTKKYIGII